MHVAKVQVSLALVFVLFSASRSLGAERALVSGTPTANLRVGPSVEQAIIITLKEGDAVMVERLDGEWYQVTAAEGQKGYIHKNLLKFSEPKAAAAAPAKASDTKEAQAREGAKMPVLPTAPVPAATPEKSAAAPADPAPAAPAPSTPVAKAPAPPNGANRPATVKSKPLIDMLIGSGMETAIWLGVALLTFVLGWICGGIHSLRRERLRRSRLIF